MALATLSDAKLVDSAAQKLETARPMVVTRYIGRLPTLTANVLQSRLPTAIAMMQKPFTPKVR